MKTRFFALATLALVLAACNNDNENLNGDPVAAQFTADIAPATRASGTTWTGGDRIGITDIGNDTQYGNVPFILKNGKFEAEEKVIYIEDTKTHTFRAYYPYNAAGGILAATTDATAQQNQPAIDFLFASGATGDKNNPVVSFTDKTAKGGEDNSFHHRMSRITLTFEAGDGVDFSVVKPERYTLDGLLLTGTFNTADGIATADNGAQTGELAMNLADGNLTSSIILFPQTVASLPLVVNYKSQEYHATLTVPEGALQAGNNYTYTVKVNATGLTLEGCTIGSWVDGGGESGEAEDLGYIYDSNTNTYTVYNADGLLAWNKAIQKDESINCTLTADIDLTGREWTRLDTWPGYSGVFNGQGHRITGLNFSAARFGLFLFLNQSGVIKNLQLIDVNLDGSSGGAAGMVDRNHGQIIACSVTGKLTVHSGGIANANYGDIIACWFNGTLKDEAGCGAIVRFNYKNIISCYWGGNAELGVLRNEGGTVVATKVDGATVKWQTAVDGMNTALTAGDYQWALGTDGLPVLQKRQ